MKQFIKYIILFSSVIVVLGGIMEYMLRRPNNMYKFKKELIETKAQQIKTMIIGSSVVNHGLAPQYMAPGTYNLAVSGEWMRFNQILLERYIGQLTGLKYIIWGQCYHGLWMDDTADFSEKSVVNHKLYMNIQAANDWGHNSELISLRAIAFRKWSKYYLKHQETMECDSLGLDYHFDSNRINPAWIKDIPGLVFKQTNYMKNDRTNLYQQNLNRIREVAILCQKKGVHLFLVIPPVYKDFKKLANLKQLEMIEIGFRSITNEFAHVHFLNYFADERFNQKDFYDGNHLNSDVGAVKFAKILSQDLEALKATF